MKFDLYYNKSDKEYINKDIDLVISVDGVFKDANNLVSPSIDLALSTDVINKFNYVYIQELKRYYYIDDITFIRNGYYNLSLSEDVLMTWKDYILQQSGVISRQENNYDLSIQDERLTVRNNAYVQTKLFPNGFNMNKDDFSYIVIIGGNNAKISTEPPTTEGA